MSRREPEFSRLSDIAWRSVEDRTVSILAVGESDEWLAKGNQMPSDGLVVFASIDQIDRDFLDRLCPSAVVSPALSARFDCIDLAQMLADMNYAGRYRAVSNELPNPELVEREIAQLCPSLDFGILVSI